MGTGIERFAYISLSAAAIEQSTARHTNFEPEVCVQFTPVLEGPGDMGAGIAYQLENTRLKLNEP